MNILDLLGFGVYVYKMIFGSIGIEIKKGGLGWSINLAVHSGTRNS